MIGNHDIGAVRFENTPTFGPNADPVETRKGVDPGSLEGRGPPPGTVEQAENTTKGSKENRQYGRRKNQEKSSQERDKLKGSKIGHRSLVRIRRGAGPKT